MSVSAPVRPTETIPHAEAHPPRQLRHASPGWLPALGRLGPWLRVQGRQDQAGDERQVAALAGDCRQRRVRILGAAAELPPTADERAARSLRAVWSQLELGDGHHRRAYAAYVRPGRDRRRRARPAVTRRRLRLAADLVGVQ